MTDRPTRQDYGEWLLGTVIDLTIAIGIVHYWLGAPGWATLALLMLLLPISGIRRKLDRMERRT